MEILNATAAAGDADVAIGGFGSALLDLVIVEGRRLVLEDNGGSGDGGGEDDNALATTADRVSFAVDIVRARRNKERLLGWL